MKSGADEIETRPVATKAARSGPIPERNSAGTAAAAIAAQDRDASNDRANLDDAGANAQPHGVQEQQHVVGDREHVLDDQHAHDHHDRDAHTSAADASGTATSAATAIVPVNSSIVLHSAAGELARMPASPHAPMPPSFEK